MQLANLFGSLRHRSFAALQLCRQNLILSRATPRSRMPAAGESSRPFISAEVSKSCFRAWGLGDDSCSLGYGVIVQAGMLTEIRISSKVAKRNRDEADLPRERTALSKEMHLQSLVRDETFQHMHTQNAAAGGVLVFF